MIAEALTVTAGGFLSSAHCIGMCGGFAGAIGAARASFWPLFARQLVYNLGRVFTYAFLGALAGSAGFYLSRFTVLGVSPQQLLALVAGILMIAIGLTTLGVVRLPDRWAGAAGAFMAPFFSYFLNARGWWGYFAAGLANGFLPCGLVYAFLAMAAASGDAVRGAIVMTGFGLGTLPAMLLVGCGARFLSNVTRQRIFRFAAAFVLLLGGLTIYRGWPTRAAACCEGQGAVRVAG